MPDTLGATIRAVVDANLLVRGILSPSGTSAELIQLLKRPPFVPITSRTHLYEIYRVLGYPRLVRRYRITRRQRNRLIAQLYYRSVWVEPTGRLAVCRDPKDDYLIEMALLGRATHLISADKDLLEDPDIVSFLAEHHTQLVGLRDFFTGRGI